MRRSALGLLAAALLAAGCGNDATQPVKVSTPANAAGWVPTHLPAQGVTFDRPQRWAYALGTAPLLATLTSGTATVAVWRYPRTEPLPADEQSLDAARDALVAAAKERDPSFTVIKAKATRAAHLPAVVIQAREHVAGKLREVRSTHVYGHGGEVVVDAFAPPRQYAQLENPIFRLIVRSLQLEQPAE